MIDPFFQFFKTYRKTISQQLARPETKRIKSYPRKSRIELPVAKNDLGSLQDSLKYRQSYRYFNLEQPISLQKLSTLLKWSVGFHDQIDRDRDVLPKTYPSGGAKYPIEPYLYVAGDVEGVPKGIYHYHAPDHALECLSSDLTEENHKQLKGGFHYPFAQDVPLFLLFTFIKDRNFPKYGEFGYKIGLIEAGHIAQNVYLTATALKLACSALGGGDEELVHRLAGLDGQNETFFYTIALGERQ